jgi:hypothetical protein
MGPSPSHRPPPLVRGGHTRLQERGRGGGPNSDEGTEHSGTLGIVHVYYNPSAGIDLITITV